GFPNFLRSVPRALPWAVFFLPFQGITEHRLHLSYYRERADLGEKSRLAALGCAPLCVRVTSHDKSAPKSSVERSAGSLP
ncbi:MAG: hypothetical protein NTX50_03160, partial [Candidatus Sumerlaeota bacterium]|nr:hypothetical protein [Candidatus Sumerlaeota bacterium]